MEILPFEPKTVKSYMLPMQEMRILAIGDMQYGAPCDIERLKKAVRWGMEQKCYFIGMGDPVDIASPSNRKAWQIAEVDLYDSFRDLVHDAVARKVDELIQILEPTRGRWLGTLTGHHNWPFGDKTTSDSRIAMALKAPMLGHCGYIILQFHEQGGTAIAKIWAHHGAGGGLTSAAPLNRLEHITKTFFAHVYLMGHQHKMAVSKIPWINYTVGPSGKIRDQSCNRYLVATGSFLKGYEVGTRDAMGLPAGSYVEQKMLTPVALGCPLIMIRPRLKDGYWSVDVNVSI